MVLMGLQICMFELLQWKITTCAASFKEGPGQSLWNCFSAASLASPKPVVCKPGINWPTFKIHSYSRCPCPSSPSWKCSTGEQTISCCRGGNCRVLRFSLNNRLKSWSMLSLLGLWRGPVPCHKKRCGCGRNKQLGIVTAWSDCVINNEDLNLMATNLKSVGNSTAKWTATCNDIPVTPVCGLANFCLTHQLFLWKFRRFEEHRIDAIKAGAWQ